MRRKRTIIGLLLLSVMLALSAGVADAKKKKAKGPGAVDITKAASQPIPAATAAAQGFAQSTVDVGRQFKGKRVRDVNVTVQLTGTGTNPLFGVVVKLTAPSGATSNLLLGLAPGNLAGPLTLDDEAPLTIISSPGPATNQFFLYAPWQGTAQPAFGFLSAMDDGPVRGTWTLSMINSNAAVHTASLVSWRLQVAAGKPFTTR